MKKRVVLDTNIYVSRFIRPTAIPGQAVAKAWTEATTLMSTATWAELQSIFQRPKLQRYIAPGLLEPYLNYIKMLAEPVTILTPIRACRDPRDDKFLDLAVYGPADVIVTGDLDQLDLHPFRGIPILSPAQYLARD
jgi:putative PIN family toxin of toxin-antitoxin system